MPDVRFAIEGMTCGGCVKSVTSVLNRLDGVKAEQVSVGSAEVSFDAAKTSAPSIAKALTDAGFPAQPAQENGA
ncbi:MAG: heavy-metal-associated domain-containing protein [Pirellulaceae bacterium]